MTNERATELFRQYRRTGDIKIRNELVENYMYVAQILAKKFAGRGVEYDDLLQVAAEALISGVEKFDPDMGNKFTTYITPTITGIIRNYFRDYSRSVRLPARPVSPTGRSNVCCRNGTTTASPKNPSTTEGMPLSNSITGLSTWRIRSSATSER